MPPLPSRLFRWLRAAPRDIVARPARTPPALPPIIVALALLCLLPELVLLGADHGMWGAVRWRSIAYGWGGFWPGLLQDWRPNWPGQPWMMFATYAFLHSGFFHMAGNILTLAWVGTPLVLRVGQGRLAALFVLSAVGGGIGYAVLAPATVPMVGASGGLFGLAGAWAAWEYIDRYIAAERLWPVGRLVAVLIGLNLFLWWAMDGQLAWQTHLGGFVAGWVVALILDPRPRARA